MYFKSNSSRSGHLLSASSRNKSRKYSPGLLAQSTILALLAVTGAANAQTTSGPQVAKCTSTFSECAIPENVFLQFPPGFVAISGDAALAPNLNSDLTAVRDVFRLNNDFIDTGAGTGLGFSAILFGGEHAVPSPSAYSANVVEITKTPEGHGDTLYLGNGTQYDLETGVLHNRPGSKTSLPAKTGVLDLIDGEVGVAIEMGTDPGQGPQQDSGLAQGLAFYSANYTSLAGKQLPFQIVGTDPSKGAASTLIPTVIVPIKVVYQIPNAPTGTLDGTNVVPAVQNSPIFQNANYTVGGTDVGTTQYGDAVQRAQFFNLSGFSRDYHVLLGNATVAPTVTVNITKATDGTLLQLRNGGLIGVVRSGVLNAAMRSQLSSFTANMLPIFLTDNVFESSTGKPDGTCCVLGFHNSTQPPANSAQTWIYNAYTETGTFGGNAVLDVQPLSHEVAEWLNDPFVGALAPGFLNFIPPAVLPGTGGACIINFETGDPLEAPPAVFTKTINGTTYHLQDEVFLSWYLHSAPSFSVNGWFSFQNTFKTPSSLCGPG